MATRPPTGKSTTAQTHGTSASESPSAVPDVELSSTDIYELQGDTLAALKAVSDIDKPTAADQYNRSLLTYLAGKDGTNSSLRTRLNELEEQFVKTSDEKKAMFPRKRKRTDWILAYNRAVAHLAAGDYYGSIDLCNTELSRMIQEHTKPPEEIAKVSSRMALVLLEAILAISVGSHAGLYTKSHLSVEAIVSWLELLDAEADAELKFLLALYKSRLDFGARNEQGKLEDAKIRSSRKELKLAMEVFQHKLRPQTAGETASLGSSSEVDSVEPKSTAGSLSMQRQQQPISIILQRQNQAVLSLKANIEQLKGNTKKSLILCGEALSSVAGDSSYESVHENNLAVIYETNGRRHLALHAMAKALRSKQAQTCCFHSDGTARPDPTLMILHNSALCALQAHNYVAAYDCMARCVSQSTIFGKRPRCWLRMSEACIGIYAQLSKDKSEKKCSMIETEGGPAGVLLNNNSESVDISSGTLDQLSNNLASTEDLEQVQTRPLLRARASLEMALYLLDASSEKDPDCLSSAQLSLAYIHLENRDYEAALESAKLVLKPEENDGSLPRSGLSQRVHKQRLATAGLYASEASCALGDATSSMRYLVGNGEEDAFDRMASHLSGVTIEKAASNGKGKAQLARAQSMVRSSASAVTAVMGNLTAAKQLAMSAQAMEDAYSSTSGEASWARRAVVYCMLREGNCEAALSVLRSGR